MINMRHFAVALALVLVVASRASATQISFQGVGLGANVSATLNNTTVTGYAGEYKWGWIGAPPSGYSATFYSYCVDMLHYISASEDVAVKSTSLLTVSGVQDAGGKAA